MPVSVKYINESLLISSMDDVESLAELVRGRFDFEGLRDVGKRLLQENHCIPPNVVSDIHAKIDSVWDHHPGNSTYIGCAEGKFLQVKYFFDLIQISQPYGRDFTLQWTFDEERVFQIRWADRRSKLVEATNIITQDQGTNYSYQSMPESIDIINRDFPYVNDGVKLASLVGYGFQAARKLHSALRSNAITDVANTAYPTHPLSHLRDYQCAREAIDKAQGAFYDLKLSRHGLRIHFTKK
jgi:hypothetical protein